MKINIQADNVRLDVAKDSKGRLQPSIAKAQYGLLLVEFAKAELESMLLAFAQAAAADQGVNIQSAELTLSSTGSLGVQGSVRVKAKKAFVPVTVTVSGRADVDDRLNVTISNLATDGEGMIGSMVAGLIKGKLAGHEGRRFALAGEQLKNVRLQDLKVDAGDPLRITAKFEG